MTWNERLARMSWRSAVLIAAGWILIWLIVFAVAAWYSLHAFVDAASSDSGGIAAVGFSPTPLGITVILGPPIVLLLLRLASGSKRE